MKKRIAFVRKKYLRPTETFLYEELKNIKRYKPIVFARKKINLKKFPFKRIRRLPFHPREIANTFKRNKISLIHARFGTTGMSLLKARKIAKLPMITSFHGFDLPSHKSGRKKYVRKLPRLFRASAKVTVPSRHAKKILMKWKCPRNKIKIMYSGIDLKKFKFYERDPGKENIRIVSVGRLHKKKGYKYLIKAFRKVKKAFPSSELIIIGDGKERKNLKKLIKKWNLKKRVKIKGELSHKQVARELQKADIFCLSSVTAKDGNREGIPNSIKEAMASGLPIVSTKHGGIPELVTNGKEGYLVKEKDVKKLSEKLIELIGNPELRMEMGRKGREKIERDFDSKKQVRRLEALYKLVIKKRRK